MSNVKSANFADLNGPWIGGAMIRVEIEEDDAQPNEPVENHDSEIEEMTEDELLAELSK